MPVFISWYIIQSGFLCMYEPMNYDRIKVKVLCEIEPRAKNRTEYCTYSAVIQPDTYFARIRQRKQSVMTSKGRTERR